MPSEKLDLTPLFSKLGFKPLNRTWAKGEILLGLIAAGIGLFLGIRAVTQTLMELPTASAGLALFVLGGYLALAGHRSHLYQSSNELAAFLADEIHKGEGRGT